MRIPIPIEVPHAARLAGPLVGWAAWWECSLGTVGVGTFWASALV